MILLALDLANRTGFAFGDPEAHVVATDIESGSNWTPQPRSGAVNIANEGANIGLLMSRFDSWINDMISVGDIDSIIFEAPWIGPKTHQDTARKLMGLATHTEFVAYKREITWIRECSVGDVRRHFIRTNAGGRKKLKQLTIDGCLARGWGVRDDNEADALAVFDFAAALIQRAKAAA